MTRLMTITLTAVLLTTACGDDDNVGENCFESPELPECVEACREDPTRPFCSDMGTPADMPDTRDMGPCGDCADQLCDTESGMCVDCLSEAECPTAEASACGTDGSCEACATDDDCDHDGLPPVCVAGAGCFECGDEDVESDDCTAATPVCDGTERSCRACAEHTECAAGLCVDGACPPDSDILWVDRDDCDMGTGGTGTNADPFCEIQAALDVDSADYVAVRASSTSYAPITWTSGGVVTVVGSGDRSDVRVFQDEAGLAAVRCTNESTLTLRDLTVAGRNDIDVTSGDGLFASNCSLTLTDVSVSDNGQAGVSASGGTVTLTDVSVSDNGQAGVSASGGTVTLTDVSVSGNGGVGVTASAAADVTIRRSAVKGNDKGGLSLNGVRFVVENTVVGGSASDTNGDGTSSVGGALLAMPMSGSRFVNNTVANNFAGAGLAGGVVCAAGVTTIVNTLLWNNMGGTGDNSGCTLSNSSEGADPMLQADGYHLTESSTCCVDTADDSAAPADDIDGDERPCGAGADIGADELCP